MKSIITISLLLLSIFNLTAKDIYSISSFVSAEKGRQLVVQEDDYSASLSKFDLELRVPRDNPTIADLNEFTEMQILDWSKEEAELLDSLTKVISDIAIKENFHYNLPDSIYFVKSTMNENKGAGGYTRLNYIVFSEDIFGRPNSMIKEVIAHEIFHIISRHNAELRKDLYAVVGFKVCNEIEIKTYLKDYTISNPDAPKVDAYITLEDNEGNKHDCAMILYSKRDYSGGIMFEYLNVGFLELEKEDDGTMKMKIEYEEPIFLPQSNIKDFFSQIGRNTQYIIHPEEIIASNFQLIFADNPTISSPEIIEKIKKILKNGG